VSAAEIPRPVVLHDVRVDALDLDAAFARVDGWIREGRRGFVCFANVHVVETARRDTNMAQALAQSDLVLPDGAPIAWVLRRRLGARVPRIAGWDFFDHVCRRSQRRGLRHFFVGGTPAVSVRLRERVAELYPELVVAGAVSPPFRELTEAESASLVETINRARPDIVWIGLGAPKQELWMARHRAKLDAAVLVGIGAVFDFVAGSKPRAPEWMQHAGLEWLHRLVREPRRLIRRYAVTNSSFALEVGRELTARRLWRVSRR